MTFLLQYLLKFSLSLFVLYAFYYAVLRPLTFYQWNRFYLLCYSMLSFLIPFINLAIWIPAENNNTGYLINAIPEVEKLVWRASSPQLSKNGISSIFSWDVAGTIFLAGVFILSVRVVYQYLSLRAMKRRAVLIKTGNFEFYDVNGAVSPFSFSNAIFINSRLHTEEEFHRILEHEFVHVKQKHTIDIIVAEIICVFNWFNPFAWLIRHAIRQNLEFIADHNVLEGGIDHRQYQYLLLKVMGLPHYRIANNFSFSSLKKRITMMNKMKTTSVHLVKFLFVVPLLAVMLLAFRGTINFKKEGPVEQLAQFQKEAGILTHKKNLQATVVGSDSGLASDTIPLRPVAPLPPVKVELADVPVAAPAPPVATVLPVPPPPVAPVPPVPPLQGKKGNKKTPNAPKALSPVTPVTLVASIDTAPSAMIRVINKNGSREPLYIVDGKILPRGQALQGIAPDSIQAIDIIKGSNAIELYGVNGENGVVKVTTKHRGSADDQVTAAASTIVVRNIQEIKALIIVDGIESTKEKLAEIDPGVIKTISVLKGSSAIELYKDKGKDGVIIVTTR